MRNQQTGVTLVELPARSEGKRPAFTLVELLVVITIIAVLLALLTPAIDKAIYRAELARDAARQNSVIVAVGIYAVDFKRHYPYRAYTATSGSSPFGQINAGGAGKPDDRVPMKGYVQINKMLTDPFAPKIDIEGSKPETVVWTQYEMWFGFNYQGLPGMRKLGDRIVANEKVSQDSQSYNLIVSCEVQVRFNAHDYGSAVHRDSLDLWKPEVYQDQAFTSGGKSSATIGWYNGTAARGTVDLHYGYQDGSVSLAERIPYLWAGSSVKELEGFDVIPSYRQTGIDDDRFIIVPDAR